MRWKIVFGLLLFFPSLIFAASEQDGETIYKAHCTPCHGTTGEGNGPRAIELKIKPRNHTQASYMSTRTDKQLKNVIRNGGISISKSPLMPAWKDKLSEKQIEALVRHLRKLCSCEFDSIMSDSKLRTVDLEFRE